MTPHERALYGKVARAAIGTNAPERLSLDAVQDAMSILPKAWFKGGDWARDEIMAGVEQALMARGYVPDPNGDGFIAKDK